MIILFTLLLGAIGYFYYISKDEVSLVQSGDLKEQIEEDDLYKDLEDLFI